MAKINDFKFLLIVEKKICPFLLSIFSQSETISSGSGTCSSISRQAMMSNFLPDFNNSLVEIFL